MIRSLDLLISGLLLIILFPLLLLVTCIVWVDVGAPLFSQQRLGLRQQPFWLIKFRTMPQGTPQVPTHFIRADQVSPVGQYLRRYKIDELPQLWNVLRGEMSLVGPRPNLPSQGELIEARERLDVYAVRPGITGLAQIRGVDMSTPERLAQVDALMVSTLTIRRYVQYLWCTLVGRGRGDRTVDR